jgi:hypothetical protein
MGKSLDKRGLAEEYALSTKQCGVASAVSRRRGWMIECFAGIAISFAKDAGERGAVRGRKMDRDSGELIREVLEQRTFEPF